MMMVVVVVVVTRWHLDKQTSVVSVVWVIGLHAPFFFALRVMMLLLPLEKGRRRG